MSVSDDIVNKLIDKYNINTSIVPIKYIKKAIDIEFEHKALIDHNTEKAFIIAMAHLEEFPDYYQRLIKLEKDADKFWKNKIKPSIYNGSKQIETKVRASRSSPKEIKQRRAGRDLYGTRKSTKKRREIHTYPDYIPKRESGKTKQEKDEPEAKRNAGWRTSTSRGIQTISKAV